MKENVIISLADSNYFDLLNELIDSIKRFEESKKDSYRSFNSPVRDKALALNALIEINPEQEQVAELAQELSKDLKNKRYLSTQERSFAFLAWKRSYW